MFYFKRKSWVYYLAVEICTEINASSPFLASLHYWVYYMGCEKIQHSKHLIWKDLQTCLSYLIIKLYYFTTIPTQNSEKTGRTISINLMVTWVKDGRRSNMDKLSYHGQNHILKWALTLSSKDLGCRTFSDICQLNSLGFVLQTLFSTLKG